MPQPSPRVVNISRSRHRPSTRDSSVKQDIEPAVRSSRLIRGGEDASLASRGRDAIVEVESAEQ